MGKPVDEETLRERYTYLEEVRKNQRNQLQELLDAAKQGEAFDRVPGMRGARTRARRCRKSFPQIRSIAQASPEAIKQGKNGAEITNLTGPGECRCMCLCACVYVHECVCISVGAPVCQSSVVDAETHVRGEGLLCLGMARNLKRRVLVSGMRRCACRVGGGVAARTRLEWHKGHAAARRPRRRSTGARGWGAGVGGGGRL